MSLTLTSVIPDGRQTHQINVYQWNPRNSLVLECKYGHKVEWIHLIFKWFVVRLHLMSFTHRPYIDCTKRLYFFSKLFSFFSMLKFSAFGFPTWIWIKSLNQPQASSEVHSLYYQSGSTRYSHSESNSFLWGTIRLKVSDWIWRDPFGWFSNFSLNFWLISHEIHLEFPTLPMRSVLIYH